MAYNKDTIRDCKKTNIDYTAEDFEFMVRDWEMEQDFDDSKGDFVIYYDSIRFDEEIGGHVCDAEDDCTIYILVDDGSGNIKCEYDGTK